MVTPSLKRVWFRSDDLSAFAGSDHTDRYVKIIFLKPGVDYPKPLDMRALRGVLPPEDMPPSVPTPRCFPTSSSAPWPSTSSSTVTRVSPGLGRPPPVQGTRCWSTGRVAATGPIRPPTGTSWWATTQRCRPSPQPWPPSAPTPWSGCWCRSTRRSTSPGSRCPAAAWSPSSTVGGTGLGLVDAVRNLDWPTGRVHAFVHGEASDVMHGIRPYLLAGTRSDPRPGVHLRLLAPGPLGGGLPAVEVRAGPR